MYLFDELIDDISNNAKERNIRLQNLNKALDSLLEIKNKFDKLVGDKKLRREMGKNGRNYYEKNCNVEISVKKLERYMLIQP